MKIIYKDKCNKKLFGKHLNEQYNKRHEFFFKKYL